MLRSFFKYFALFPLPEDPSSLLSTFTARLFSTESLASKSWSIMNDHTIRQSPSWNVWMFLWLRPTQSQTRSPQLTGAQNFHLGYPYQKHHPFVTPISNPKWNIKSPPILIWSSIEWTYNHWNDSIIILWIKSS